MLVSGPVVRKCRNELDRTFAVFNAPAGRAQDIEPVPCRAFGPGTGRVLIEIRTMVRMKRREEVIDLFHDIGAVARAHELFRCCRLSPAFYYRFTTVHID